MHPLLECSCSSSEVPHGHNSGCSALRCGILSVPHWRGRSDSLCSCGTSPGGDSLRNPRTGSIPLFFQIGSLLPARISENETAFRVVNFKVTSSVGVVPVFAVLGFLLVHGEFHIFLHAMLFTVQIIVEAAIPSVRYGILWIL